MELRHIRYFLRTAELLHFTRAAESLYVSQPSLSAHIQQLEEELDVRLFDRTGRNVHLTESGKVFLKHAQRALQNVDLATQKIANLKELTAGTIRLGALTAFMENLLPVWIASFHARYPDLRLNVKSGSSDLLESELQQGDIDLALSFLPPTSPEEIRGETLFTESIYLVVGLNHPLSENEEISVQTLGQLPLALVGRSWAARRLYDAMAARHNITPDVQVEAEDVQTLLTVASEGRLAVLMSKLAVGDYPNLKLIRIAEETLTIDYGILWRSHGTLSPAADALLSHIRKS